MPSVIVVPVYVEVPGGFERAVPTLESHLRLAGYAFHTGEPIAEDLEETKARLASSNNGCIKAIGDDFSRRTESA